MRAIVCALSIIISQGAVAGGVIPHARRAPSGRGASAAPTPARQFCWLKSDNGPCDPASLSEKADIIVVAEVERVRKSPGHWSGFGAAVQYVDYKVTRVLKGSGLTDGGEFVAGFLLDSGSSLVDEDTPKLSEKVLAASKQHVLFIKVDSERRYGSPTGGTFFAPNDHVGLVEANEETLNSLRRIISGYKPPHTKT